MTRKACLRALSLPLALTVTACGTASPPPASSQEPPPVSAPPVSAPPVSAAPEPIAKPATLAHEILALEGTALPTPPAMSALLDTVISTAKARISAAQPGGGGVTSARQARDAFATIARVLGELHFVYPGRGFTDRLHDALSPVNVDAGGLERLAGQAENRHVADLIRRAPTAAFYAADCDILSFLYVSIGEALGFPIAMVDLPTRPGGVSHNYVRWTLPDGSRVDWETTFATERDAVGGDILFFMDAPRTYDHAIATRAFGVSMSRDETLGYAHLLLADIWRRLGSEERALAALRTAMQKRPTSPVAINEVAWLLATSSDPTVRDPKEAVRVGEQLLQLWPSANYLDTVAAAYAAEGRMEDALRTQQAAIRAARSHDPKAEGFRRRCAAYVKKERYLQSRRPEREMESAREALQNGKWDDLVVRLDSALPGLDPLPPECAN